MFGLVGHYVEEICDFSYDHVISCLQVEFTIIYAFLLYWVVTHFYRSLYDACFFNYWCFVAKTVVCVACEEDGSLWGLDTEVRSWSKFSFSLLTSIRRGSEILTYQNKKQCELRRPQRAYVCVLVSKL
jgi:hypothetical protein